MKPSPPHEVREVRYGRERWELLRRLRGKALGPMRILQEAGLEPLLHGSVARGDVDEKSDVDIWIPTEVRAFRVELALREAGYEFERREIIMATPWQLPKAHLYLHEGPTVSFPLLKPLPSESDFYHFGGVLNLQGMVEGRRVPGVNKKLMLIEPTREGHLESSILGREGEVAKKLGVGLEIVRERIQVLTRRAEVGHTGVYFTRRLAPHESFEDLLPEVIRRIRKTCRR